MRRLVAACAALCFCLTALAGTQLALEDIDTQPLQKAYSMLPGDVAALWEGGVDAMLEALFEGDEVTGGFLQRCAALASNELKKCARSMLPVLALAVAGGVCANLAASNGKGVSEAAGFACDIMAAAASAYVFADAVAAGKDTVTVCAELCEAAFPVLLGLLASCGCTASAGLFQPATAMLAGGMTWAANKLITPLTLGLGGLAVMAGVCPAVQLKSLQGLFKSVIKWSLGALGTLYLGVLSLRSINARAADGLAARAARYALDKFVPYVGGIVSGSFDSVAGINVLIKNSFGLCFSLLLFGVMALPLLRLALARLCFMGCAALCEPLGASGIVRTLGDMADALGCMFAAAAVALLMALLTAGMILCCAV